MVNTMGERGFRGFHNGFLWDIMGLIVDFRGGLPSGKLTVCETGKIHHVIAGQIHYKLPFSIANC